MQLDTQPGLSSSMGWLMESSALSPKRFFLFFPPSLNHVSGETCFVSLHYDFCLLGKPSYLRVELYPT